MHASKLISFAERKLKSPNKTKLIGKINVNVHNVAKILSTIQNQVSEPRRCGRRVLGSWQTKTKTKAVQSTTSTSSSDAKSQGKSEIIGWPTCVGLASSEAECGGWGGQTCSWLTRLLHRKPALWTQIANGRAELSSVEFGRSYTGRIIGL